MITSVLKPKFAQEIRGLPTVIPAKAGIHKLLFFWIPGRASYRQLARNYSTDFGDTRLELRLLPILNLNALLFAPCYSSRELCQ
jgi:hypothetical protein